MAEETENANTSPAHVDVAPPAQAAPPKLNDEVDLMESLLSEMTGTTEEWTMSVHRLVNYRRDGRADPAAPQPFCGTLPFSDNYLEDVQAAFGGGEYLLKIKQKGRIRKVTAVFIEAAFVEEEDDEPELRQMPTNTVAPVATPPTVEEMMRSEIEKAKLLKELRDLYSPDEPPKATPESTLTDEDRITLAVAKNANMLGTITANMSQAMASGGVQGTDWKSLFITELLRNPQYTNRALGILDRITSRFMPKTAQAEEDVAQTDADEPVEEDSSMQLFDSLLDRIMQIFMSNITALPTPEMVQEIASQHPLIFPQLKTVLLSETTKNILLFIVNRRPAHESLLSLPQARQWIKRLKEICAQTS